jgi:cytokinesis protein
MVSEDTRRRNDASMKRKQATLASPAGTETPPSPGATSGAMDDLLAKLRAAKPEARDTRDRRRRARLKDKHAVRVASGQKIQELTVSNEKVDAALLSPASEVSNEGSGAETDNDTDIADRAASLLQDLGGDSGDQAESSGGVTTRDSLRVRRRREGAEEERNRRRQRRQQARSEISTTSQPNTEDGDEEEDGDVTIIPSTPPRDQSPSRHVSPTKIIPPVTIISPPSPESRSSSG